MTAPTKSELTKLQFFTMSTCGEACWEAREEICHCSCHGKNHGILRTGTRPKRTCKMGNAWYELFAIVDYPSAKKQCFELRNADSLEHPENYPGYNGHTMVYWDSKPGDTYHCKAVSESQRKWQEVQNSGVEGYIYLIWKRIPSPIA